MDGYGWNILYILPTSLDVWLEIIKQDFYYKLPQFFEVSIIQIILIFRIDFKHQISFKFGM